MICDKCKQPIRQDYPGYYEVVVRGVNFKTEFKGEYYFHQQCWDWIWAQFVKEKNETIPAVDSDLKTYSEKGCPKGEI